MPSWAQLLIKLLPDLINVLLQYLKITPALTHDELDQVARLEQAYEALTKK